MVRSISKKKVVLEGLDSRKGDQKVVCILGFLASVLAKVYYVLEKEPFIQLEEEKKSAKCAIIVFGKERTEEGRRSRQTVRTRSQKFVQSKGRGWGHSQTARRSERERESGGVRGKKKKFGRDDSGVCVCNMQRGVETSSRGPSVWYNVCVGVCERKKNYIRDALLPDRTLFFFLRITPDQFLWQPSKGCVRDS